MTDDRLFDVPDLDTRPPHQRSRLEDPGLPARGKARRDGSDTMRRAARLVMPRTGTQRRKVLEDIAFGADYGRTDEECQMRTGLDANTERPRRIELVEMGWICDSRLRRTTSSGSQAAVWILSEAGREEFR